MITAKTISIIIDVLALLFILVGFLIGLKRGLKSSINRILLVFISAILAVIVTRLISSSVLGISLPFLKNDAGSATSVNGYIDNILKNYALTDTITLASFTLTIEALVSIIKLFANVVIFLVLFEFFRFISWIFYMIFFRTKKKDIIAAKEAGQNVNLHRWWGSLVGAFQGLFIFVFLFLPISGISSLAADMSSTASAANEKEGAGIIETFVPKEYVSYVNVYENSIFNKAFGWTKFDEFMFDSLTTAKVGGAELKLRNEVKSVNEVVKTLNKYEIIDTFKDKKFEEKLNNLSDEEIKAMFSDIFEGTTNFLTIKCVLIDASNVLSDSLEVNKHVTIADIDWKKEGETFGDAISDIVSAMKPIVSKILDKGTGSLNDEILTSSDVDYERFGQGFDKLAKMQLIKDSYKAAAKKAFSIEKFKQLTERYQINLSVLDLDSENISFASTFKTLGGLLKIAVKIKNSPSINELATTGLATLLQDIKDNPTLAENLNGAVSETFKQFGVDVPDDFKLFDEENEELLESTILTMASLGEVEQGESLTSEQASEVLSNIENILNSDNSEVILDVVASATGSEKDSLPEVDQAKDAVTYLNDFINEDSEDPAILDGIASDLVTALNANTNLIKLLTFKGNTYKISQAKMDSLNRAGASGEIKALFTVEE